MMIPIWLSAGLWGIASASALLVGALLGAFLSLPKRAIAGIMAFGGGVLLSAVSFQLVTESVTKGGFLPTLYGVVGGSLIFTIANWMLSRTGAKHRKRSGPRQPSEEQHQGSGLSIALGSLLDGIPESLVIGIGAATLGGHIPFVTIVAIFLSDVPEGLSSTSGMRAAGRSLGYVFGVWTTIVLVCGLSSVAGYVFFRATSPFALSLVLGSAAGAILTMVSDTMIPEAFEESHNFTGLIATAGFILALYLSMQTS